MEEVGGVDSGRLGVAGLYESCLVGEYDGLCSIARVELGEELSHMRFDCRLTEEEGF